MKKKTLKVIAAGFTALVSVHTAYALYSLSQLKKIRGNYKTTILQTDKKISLLDKEFSGDSLLVAFGALELDLRGAIPASESISITIKAMYCGVKIIVPENWSVRTQGKTFLAGITNKCKEGKVGETQLIIHYDIKMAGLDIVN